MHIITLTTDFGTEDHYVAVLKAAILRIDPTIQIIDISHNIKNFDIVQAAYTLKNVYQEFPEGSLHLSSVDNINRKSDRFIFSEHKGHFFALSNNGLLSMIIDEEPEKVYRLPFDENWSFPEKHHFAKAVDIYLHPSKRQTLDLLDVPIEKRISLQAVTSSDQIKGTVVHVDHYGNAILNISKVLFEQIGKGRSFKLFFKAHSPITEYVSHYSEADVGEVICLFNSADCLEVAVNMNRADQLLGLKVGDAVVVRFG